MSTLALLVVLLLVITGILFLGAIGYPIDRHPRLAKPLGACGTWAAALIATVALVGALRFFDDPVAPSVTRPACHVG